MWTLSPCCIVRPDDDDDDAVAVRVVLAWTGEMEANVATGGGDK